MQIKGSIGNLISRYKAVLNKCRIMNTFGSLAMAAMLTMGGAGTVMAADYYKEAPSAFDQTFDQPGQQSSVTIEKEKNILVSGKNTSSEDKSPMAVTGVSGSPLYNNGNIWVTDGYAEGMGGRNGDAYTILNQGNIYVNGTMPSASKGMGVGPDGTAVNLGVIAVRKGSGMADNAGSADKSMQNSGVISVEDAGGIGIYYRKEAVTGEVANHGEIHVSNGGTGVVITSDETGPACAGKVFVNTGSIVADGKSTAIFVTDTDNATVELTDESHVDGLIKLQGTNNRLVVGNVGSAGTEQLHVKGAFSGSVAGSNVAFRGDSGIILDNAFSIDKTSAVSMSGVELAAGSRQGSRGSIVLDKGNLILNGGLDAASGSVAALNTEKGNVVIDGAVLSGNRYQADGAPAAGIVAAMEEGRSLTVKHSTFTGNRVESASSPDPIGGAALAVTGGRGAVVVENSTFKSNGGAYGGALYNQAGGVTIRNSTFEGNTASASGGAIYNTEGSSITFSGVNVFSGNSAAGRANDIHNKGAITVADGRTFLNGSYTQEGASSGLTVQKGATLALAMPDTGGVTGSAGQALLALGAPLNVDEGTLTVGTVKARGNAAAAFGADSVLVVDGKAASQEAMLRSEKGGSVAVEKGAGLYIANAQAGETYTITEGLSAADGEYWSRASLLGNRLTEADIHLDGGRLTVSTDAQDAATVLPGIIPAKALNTMMAGNLNDTESASMGIRFLSRAMDQTFVSSDSLAAATVNEVSRAAVTAGVQNTALRLAEAGADQIARHLSLSFFNKESNIHADGLDVWATPMYGNTYTHGMAVSGTSVRGNYGGLALGADTQVGEMLGGKVRVGASVHGGGGKSDTRGTATDTENSYNFGGVNLYAGWNLDNLNIMASVGFAAADHDVKMSLPSSLGMNRADSNVNTNAFLADLRAEYMISTPAVDILLHAGVRYTALNTESHDVTVGGRTLNTVDSDTRHIVQFPVGVTVSRDIDVSGWTVKPQADVSVIPAAGDRNHTTKVSWAGIHATDSVNTRIMDATSFSGMVGLQAEKGNLALGLNYGVQASRHETDQRVNVGISWKF